MTEQELVERLRAYADDDHERLCEGRNYDCTCGYDERRDPLLADAADAIERLVRERDEAQATVTAWDSVFGDIASHIKDRINMRDPERQQRIIEAAESRASVAEAQLAEMREALKPFARLADIPERFGDAETVHAGIDYTMSPEEVDHLQGLSGGALKSDRATLVVSLDELTAGHFRAARRALEQSQ